jgi:hypothetical protein
MPILLFPLDAINHDLVLLVTDRWGNNLTPVPLFDYRHVARYRHRGGK